ncbi:flavin reductase family protein [Streptomyces sp. NPDC051105]|uniref:flavin reductase family protein n=1 Tax=Streptomyces sp. NPDC051105 TaxID=3154843 RepID=UPI00341AF6F2
MHDNVAPLSAERSRHAEDSDPVMPASLRHTLSRFASGVVVITVGGSEPHAMTASAFSSVSLDPPSVLCCVSHSAVMHASLEKAGRFGISILSAEQEQAAAYFADKRRPLGMRQFDAVKWRPGEHTAAPLIEGALAWLECEVLDAYVAGDHTIFLGSVLSSAVGPKRAGLLFFEGMYREVTTNPQAPR